MDLNKAMIIGRLTRDPEARTLQSGNSVSNFSVATSYNWTDKSGQKQEKTEYHDVVAWRKLADICNQYLRKGSRVYIEGRLQTRSWEDQNGVKKYRTEIVANNMIMLDSKGSGGGGAPAGGQAPGGSDNKNINQGASPQQGGGQQDDDEEIKIEDIPFA